MLWVEPAAVTVLRAQVRVVCQLVSLGVDVETAAAADTLHDAKFHTGLR